MQLKLKYNEDSLFNFIIVDLFLLPSCKGIRII